MRVVFTGDLARGAQASNICRTHDLFSPIFRRLGIETQVHVSAINRSLDRAEWLESWRKALDSHDTTDLDALDLSDAVVFGFEMSEPMIEALNVRGVRWVNAYIHPARFGADLFFHFDTSFEADLSDSLGSETGLFLAANQLMQRSPTRPPSKDDCKTLLLLGQEPRDRSLYFDGEFRNLLSYREKLHALAKEFDRVLYKPHIANTDPELDLKILSTFGAERVEEANFYTFLTQNKIDLCCAISSSTIHEARFFGTEALFLEPRAKQFGPIVDYSRTLSDGALWAGQFLQMPEGVALLTEAPVRVPPNLLRTQYSSWGYFSISPDMERQDLQIEKLSADLKRQELKAAGLAGDLERHELKAAGLSAELEALRKKRYVSRLWRKIKRTFRRKKS